ncbi:matrixin family metalloprotease [Empedobacter brevis]|uniref:matrixin family metalloprotease n=1 Tax=Empedobacter brevis TaxID=247 RepID=UPI0028A0012E|nr:matrixin family metalloprotease [Empedobacter brevis]
MIRIYSLCLILIISFTIYSCEVQQSGLIYPNQTGKNSSGITSIINEFILSENLTPLTIRINVIVLKRDDGTGNYNLENPEEKEALENFMNANNYAWSTFTQPNDLTGCYTGKDFYPDAKIRFKFNYIEIKDSYAWNYKNSGADLQKKKYSGMTPHEDWYLAYLDQKIANSPSVPKGINIYLTMDADNYDRLYNSKGENYDLNGVAAGQLPSSTNLNRTSSTHLPNRYLKYLAHRYIDPKKFNTTLEETMKWDINDGRIFAHELGHALGLNHSNQYHSANKCKYSMMSQKWDDPKNYLQPTEILKVHKNLRETNLIQFVTEDSFLGNTFLINENTKWEKTQRFYSNLIIKENIALTITEKIIFSPQAKIIFEKNSSIIFENNGKIIYPNGKEFSNYVNKKNTSIVQN